MSLATKLTINATVPLLQNDPKSFISTYWFKILSALLPGTKVVQVPVTGFSITVSDGVETLILDPAGTLATGTVILPASANDGDIFNLTSSQTITGLTVSPSNGQSVKNAPTALTVSTTAPMGYSFIYNSSNSTWYRLR